MTAQPDYVPEYDDEPADLGPHMVVGQDLQLLTQSVNALSETVLVALDTDDTAEAVVQLLADLRAQHKTLGEICSFVEAAAVKRLRYGKQQIGDRLVEVKGGWNRQQWHHPNLMRAVCHDLIHDDNGVINEDMASALAALRDRILQYAHIDYWKVSELRDAGLDADEFCSKVDGRRRVILTAAVDEQAVADA